MPCMALTLSIFGVAFAAFCIWLTVRIIKRRERWAKWTMAIVAGLPVLYVLNFGPATWIWDHGWITFRSIRVAYQPISSRLPDSPKPISQTLNWWGNVASKTGRGVELQILAYQLRIDDS